MVTSQSCAWSWCPRCWLIVLPGKCGKHRTLYCFFCFELHSPRLHLTFQAVPPAAVHCIMWLLRTWCEMSRLPHPETSRWPCILQCLLQHRTTHSCLQVSHASRVLTRIFMALPLASQITNLGRRVYSPRATPGGLKLHSGCVSITCTHGLKTAISCNRSSRVLTTRNAAAAPV